MSALDLLYHSYFFKTVLFDLLRVFFIAPSSYDEVIGVILKIPFLLILLERCPYPSHN